MPAPTTPSPSERLWSEFTEWMRAQRGTMSSTLISYRLPISALLQNLGTDPQTFTAERLRHFLLSQVKPRKTLGFATPNEEFAKLVAKLDDTNDVSNGGVRYGT
ncbi:hypothetical protein CU669_20790 [Paramagnetospirillum kuznetsovii]|uniref:Core-binding (CB) domain-containing protein n=2 Tax=Paramagnetospirillum kuznetsovii TaxID=2053833 RepID=A0A364NSU8_9PROT|nr:hypothetical protein CU669_20790 [Paramagnetospirillum kuznetsovii]